MTALAKDTFAPTGAVFLGASNATPGTPGAGAPRINIAAGVGDAAAVTGNTINRNTYGMPESLLVVATSYYSLADTETMSLAVEIQESTDGTTWVAAEALQAATVVVTASGATAQGQTNTYTVKLTGRRQYFRINHTPNLSAAGVDTSYVTLSGVLAGGWNTSLLPAHQVEA